MNDLRTRFVHELRARSGGAVRVRLDAMWAAHARTVGSDPDRRATLRRLLDQSATCGDLALAGASSAGWDRAAHPPLPPWVALRAPVQDATPGAKGHPWCAELAFVEDLPERGGRAEWLLLDAWLKGGGRRALPVPLRERSWEVLGDEKRLERSLCGRRPFVDGTLDLESLLRAFDTPEPMAPGVCARAHGRPMLVVENTAAFHSLSAWNAAAARWSAVAYGRGNSFATSWRSLPELCARMGTSTVRYAGDVDRMGLEIPAGRMDCMRAAGLQLVPDAALYRGMLDAAAGREGPAQAPWQVARTARGWLPSDLEARVDALAAASRRVPQESFGTQALHAIDHLDDQPDNA